MTALPILFAKGLTKIVPLVAASMFVKFKRNDQEALSRYFGRKFLWLEIQ